MTSTSYDINLANPPSVEPSTEECEGCRQEFADCAYAIGHWESHGVRGADRVIDMIRCPDCIRNRIAGWANTADYRELDGSPFDLIDLISEPCGTCRLFVCRCP